MIKVLSYLVILMWMGLFAPAVVGQGPVPAPPGTFQLITTEPKAGEVFSTDLLPFISSQRHPHVHRLVNVAPHTWVFVLAQEAVDRPDFQPRPDEAVVVDHATIVQWLLLWP